MLDELVSGKVTVTSYGYCKRLVNQYLCILLLLNNYLEH